MPVLIFLMLLPIQFALWWHGQQAAAIAAEECLDAAQAIGADVNADGTGGAMSILSQAGNLTNVSVRSSSDGTIISCDVSGQLRFSIVGRLSVSSRAEGPAELITFRGDG